MSAPKGLTCASGIDVMTHALEAYASMMASDYTDGPVSYTHLDVYKRQAEYVYNAYKNTRTCGVIEEDTAYGIKKIAEPVSYTHLDVYKRQPQVRRLPDPCDRYSHA